LKLLDIQSPLRTESSDSITLAKSFIEACQSDNMSIFVDALNVWHERPPEVDFEGLGAKHNTVRYEAMTQPESTAWECIQSLIQPSQSAGQIVLLGCPSNSMGGPLVPCTVKRAAVVVHLILTDDIAGGDGSITTPVGPSQLVIRLDRSLMSRENAAAPISTYTFGECQIDFSKMTACRAGKPVSVTTLELKLLKYFLDNAERVLSRAELLDEVWGYDCYPTTRTVDNLILKLRQKLERSPAEPRHLHTVYGAGYKFVP
jgi:hypothetical protein